MRPSAYLTHTPVSLSSLNATFPHTKLLPLPQTGNWCSFTSGLPLSFTLPTTFLHSKPARANSWLSFKYWLPLGNLLGLPLYPSSPYPSPSTSYTSTQPTLYLHQIKASVLYVPTVTCTSPIIEFLNILLLYNRYFPRAGRHQ